jgi:hypothetical protein
MWFGGRRTGVRTPGGLQEDYERAISRSGYSVSHSQTPRLEPSRGVNFPAEFSNVFAGHGSIVVVI